VSGELLAARRGYVAAVSCCFFFSSRRRHTRSKRDWSSDVCSSDLSRSVGSSRRDRRWAPARRMPSATPTNCAISSSPDGPNRDRSEERRVGKECRGRRAREQLKEKERETVGSGTLSGE